MMNTCGKKMFKYESRKYRRVIAYILLEEARPEEHEHNSGSVHNAEPRTPPDSCLLTKILYTRGQEALPRAARLTCPPRS